MEEDISLFYEHRLKWNIRAPKDVIPYKKFLPLKYTLTGEGELFNTLSIRGYKIVAHAEVPENETQFIARSINAPQLVESVREYKGFLVLQVTQKGAPVLSQNSVFVPNPQPSNRKVGNIVVVDDWSFKQIADLNRGSKQDAPRRLEHLKVHEEEVWQGQILFIGKGEGVPFSEVFGQYAPLTDAEHIAIDFDPESGDVRLHNLSYNCTTVRWMPSPNNYAPEDFR